MFSFRTTSLEEQFDKALQEGKVGAFCTQNCWDTQRGRYMYDIFRERGNLQVIFMPRDTELTPHSNHIEFRNKNNEFCHLAKLIILSHRYYAKQLNRHQL